MDKKDVKFAFLGTPDVAEYTLEKLKEAGFLPSLIVTAPDRPQGRKMVVTPPPVKIWCEKNSVPVVQPETKTELLDVLSSRGIRLSHTGGRSDEKQQEAKFDLFIVVAYGKILPEELLKAPRLGSINIHYSLLPKYRGASPVESAILNGDLETGVTIQQMEFKMDAGPILAQKATKIGPSETAPELRKRLQELGAELLIETLPKIITNKVKPKDQDEAQATYCTKIKKSDGEIDLNDDSQKNYNKFRAYKAWPRTFFFTSPKPSEGGFDKSGKRVIITEAELIDGKFVIKKIIPEGGKERDYKESLN